MCWLFLLISQSPKEQDMTAKCWHRKYLYKRFGAKFANSLRQRKQSFDIKIIASGFTKDAQWKISTEKVWTQLFLYMNLLNIHL